jgi:hypothetical protein
MSLPFLQQGQDLCRLSTPAAAGEDSMNAHVDDDNVVRVIDLFVKSLNMPEPTFYPKPNFLTYHLPKTKPPHIQRCNAKPLKIDFSKPPGRRRIAHFYLHLN